MRDRRRLVFHIGLEKTATSSLQACLHQNTAALRRHALLYPSRNLAFGHENHKPLVGCYGVDDARDNWLAVDPSRRAATIASLIGEIEAARESTAVVSAEHFSSRFREPNIRQLRDDFDRFDCRVMIVIRDHVSRLASGYETYVTNGGTVTFDEFAEGAMRHGTYELRYADLVADWARIFGRDRVELIAYGPDVIRDVLSRLAPGLDDEPGLDGFRLRRSAGADVVAALRVANAVSSASAPRRWADGAWVRDHHRRLQIRTWLQQSLPSPVESVLALDDEVLDRLTEMAALDTARLDAEYGFALKVPETSSPTRLVGDEQAAELLARALHARAAQPWTKSSLVGVADALTAKVRSGVTALRRTRRRLR